MSQGPPQFTLWHPHFSISGESVTCLVDVVRANVDLIDRGDDELVRNFADALGLADATIVGWTLTGFNTPYYSFDIDSDELASWMSPAWRLRLDIEGWKGGDTPPVDGSGGIPAWGLDTTWFPEQRSWDWNAQDTVVIAFDGPDPELDFVADLALPAEVETLTYDAPRFDLGQVRLSLGRVDLPDQADAVFDVVLACHDRAFVVHVDDSHTLFLP